VNEFYVYLHRRKSDNKVCYVGKGKGERAYKVSGRNERWQRTRNKHGINVEIVFDNLSEDDAFQIEKDTILEMKYFGYPLCNMTNGGEGATGYVPSDEARKKISEANKGRFVSQEWRDNMSKAQKGRKLSQEHIERMRLSLVGHKQTEETKRKRAETLKVVGTCNDRNSYVFYSKDDLFIGTRKELADHIGTNSRSLRNIFGTNPQAPSAKGWSLLNLQQLLILRNLYNDNNCN
jgi:hypothetical protein